MMRRRDFLLTTAAAGAGAALLGAAEPAPAKPASALRLTILHTNDVHSHLEPMERGQFAGIGGAPARASFVAAQRRAHANVLLLDAGDILQGTPYFNLFHGEPEIAAMNAMGYDAAAIGNHEFDAGIERLGELARDHMKFPFLCANYDFTGTPMEGLARDSMVIERDGLRIGLLGLGIRLDGLVLPRLYTGTRYLDPIEAARRAAVHLREEEKADFIICLSHLSLGSARRAAGTNNDPGDRDLIHAVPQIDLILGGHNHFLLPTPEVHWRGGDHAPGYIAQAGWAGTHMGVLQFDIHARGQVELARAGCEALTGTA
jgi:5'-nucleotidase